MRPVEEETLRAFRQSLADTYGARLDRVVLYGSRARGDQRPDSDFDIAVFLKSMDSFGAEARRLADLEADVLRSTGLVFSSLPFVSDDYLDPGSALMFEMRREGRVL